MSLRCLLSDELSNVAINMRKLVGTKHPLLKTARGLVYDGRNSQQTRGLVVLLIAKTAGQAPNQSSRTGQDMICGIYPNQRTLAEITEMIHTANLIHKGVVNLADLQPADGLFADMEFGNKMAVLSGDFLLANACTGLADLQNTYVVELISSAICDLMEAEFTGLQDKHGQGRLYPLVKFSDWLHRTYLSSGSLLGKSCKAALTLAGHSEDRQEKAFDFGVNMAYARQIHEDLKPFLKPDDFYHQISLNSAPAVKFAEANPALVGEEVQNTDVQKIMKLIEKSPVLKDCMSECHHYCQKAVEALDCFPTSDAKSALLNIVQAITKD